MQAIKLTCPHCQAVLRSPKPLPDGAQIKCVTCHKPFRVRSAMQNPSTAVSYHDGDYKLPAETLDVLNQAAGPRPLVSVSRPRRGVGGIVLLCTFLLVLFGGVAAAALYMLQDRPAPAAKAKKSPPTTQVAVGQQKPEVSAPERPKKQAPPRDIPKRSRPAPIKQVVAKEGPRAAVVTAFDPVMPQKKSKKQGPLDPAKVNEAIDRGVSYLKTHIDASGTWKPDEKFNPVGHAALPALALLECKVPASDPAIQAAARYVRQHAPDTEETYCLGCAVLFLDRLDDPADRPLIRHLALRLAAGQMSSGVWGYKCPDLNADERVQLGHFLEQHRPKIELLTGIVAEPGVPRRSPRGGTKLPAPESKPAPPSRPVRLSPRLAALPVVKYRKKKSNSEEFWLKRGDNSNTQFALLGLWAARRHGVAAESSFKFAAEHFRTTRNSDGGWGYTTGLPTKNTMTSVGLLSLAMGHGAAAEVFQKLSAKNGKPPRPPIHDTHIKDALDLMARYLDGSAKNLRGLESRIDLYLSWAIERVGVLYQTERIGKTDWYTWAAQDILKRQGTDGGWEDHYHAAIDTSFALLVLKRSNLARGLSENLHGYIEPSYRRGL